MEACSDAEWRVGERNARRQKWSRALQSAADFCMQVCAKLYEQMYEV